MGRYAPSPTGDLHFGSLVAALASYCHAKARGGLWRLRIDDLDTPRVVPGSAERIVETLYAFGLKPDGPIMSQSRRGPAYDAAIAQLKRQGNAFDCGCTRREARQGPPGDEGPIYPGTCRDGLPAGREPRSIRCRVDDRSIRLVDAVQGPVAQSLGRAVGDFVIRRADGITAYQLATVVDDAAQGITEVVRGVDLLTSSPRQRWLQQCLALPTTAYLHVPIIVDDRGEKLGKSTGALALDRRRKRELTWHGLALLGHRPPVTPEARSTSWLLDWALAHWCVERIPQKSAVSLNAV
ncbi:tRNA glutamyl-Q(34) synthetase GluQRS [Salinisphaera sp. Q1T1-3]|nr:tRNA glutamyl-Q(34) synthetase GluQRS [Salinisphaera sp. Q1T1-3]